MLEASILRKGLDYSFIENYKIYLSQVEYVKDEIKAVFYHSKVRWPKIVTASSICSRQF